MEVEKAKPAKSQATPLQDLSKYLNELMTKPEIQKTELTKLATDVLNLRKKKQISQPILNTIKKIVAQNEKAKMIPTTAVKDFHSEFKEYMQTQKN